MVKRKNNCRRKPFTSALVFLLNWFSALFFFFFLQCCRRRSQQFLSMESTLTHGEFEPHWFNAEWNKRFHNFNKSFFFLNCSIQQEQNKKASNHNIFKRATMDWLKAVGWNQVCTFSWIHWQDNQCITQIVLSWYWTLCEMREEAIKSKHIPTAWEIRDAWKDDVKKKQLESSSLD